MRIKIMLRMIVLAAWLAMPVTAKAEDLKLGDEDDGSRTTYSHWVELYDADGVQIKPGDQEPAALSLKQTCGKCHTYEKIRHGWHFNSSNPDVPAGRVGEPWVLTDDITRTQIPVSNRNWPGTYKPAEMGIDSWQYMNLFGSHMPGGNYGEIVEEDAGPTEMLRRGISGNFEINCLACHNADRRQDQNEAAMQVFQQNFRWLHTAASHLGIVEGAASKLPITFDPEFDEGISVSYDQDRFDKKNRVFFNIVREPDSERCYFCHSTQDAAHDVKTEWTRDEDIHLKAGMKCSDCHQNGRDHAISRGSENGNEGQHVSVKTLSCKGCHIGDETSTDPAAQLSGRLGAPRPSHIGLPLVHFEKLTCTACHSGPFPGEKPHDVRTARIHKLGLHGPHNPRAILPHISAPVFAANEEGKTESRKLIWPAFWAVLNGDSVKPLATSLVKRAAGKLLGVGTTLEKGENGWALLTDEQITGTLTALATSLADNSDNAAGTPAYICGGNLYQLDQAGKITVSKDHQAAQPYSWAMAHDVRPASQSLGANKGCDDCHNIANTAPLFFAKVAVDSPMAVDNGLFKEMVDLQKTSGTYIRSFNLSFIFRPMLKIVSISSCLIIALVILLYVLNGLKWLALFASTGIKDPPIEAEACPIVSGEYKKRNWIKKLIELAWVACVAVLALTGFYAEIRGVPLSGYWVMLHCTAAPVFIATTALMALFRANCFKFRIGINGDSTIMILQKMCFWVILLLAIPITMSIVLSMFPLFGSTGQKFLYEIHICTTLAFAIIVILNLVLKCAGKMKK
ncbi:MAG: hypothetical protein K9M57_01495 [Phycisphaerae bacterium]|nr:hypothetical protein [Phycisphaerae bacterium]